MTEVEYGGGGHRTRLGEINKSTCVSRGTPPITHKYRGSIVVLSISKSVEPNEEQKEMISGFQQGILCKH